MTAAAPEPTGPTLPIIVSSGASDIQRTQDLLAALSARLRGSRTLILGVGNAMRGDDAVGPELIARLRGRVDAPLLDVGDVPEDYLGPLEAAEPGAVIVVDAVDFGGRPGDIALIEIAQLRGFSLSTHNPSLALLFAAMPPGRRPDVLVLAVQPRHLDPGAGLSNEARGAIECLAAVLTSLFDKKLPAVSQPSL